MRTDDGPYKSLTREKRPCIARVERPIRLEKHDAAHYLHVNGPIEYYAITNAGVPEHVRTSSGPMGAYPVIPEYLYEASDMFPPKKQP